MIDINLVGQLFELIKSTPEITEAQMIEATVNASEHTTETATGWFNAFYIGLHEAMILDCATFDCMKDKIVNTEDLSLEVIISTMEIYLANNPLQYQIEARRKEIEDDITALEQEPDMIRNEEKFMQIDILEQQLNEL